MYQYCFGYKTLFNYDKVNEDYYLSRDIVSINTDVINFAKKFKQEYPKDFELVLTKSFGYGEHNFNKELFLTYYDFNELINYPDIASSNFIYDIDSFNTIIEMFKDNYTPTFLSNMISMSFKYNLFDKVIDSILPLVETDFRLVSSLVDKSIRDYPELLLKIRDYSYSDSEIKNKVFNTIIENENSIKDKKAIPYNINVVDNEMRQEALSILEKAIEDLF